MCDVEDCSREVNRDGLCLPHKLKTVRVDTGALKREREGTDVTEGKGTRQYVKEMYEDARSKGEPDPIPKNKKSAAFAPAKGPIRGKR